MPLAQTALAAGCRRRPRGGARRDHVRPNRVAVQPSVQPSQQTAPVIRGAGRRDGQVSRSSRRRPTAVLVFARQGSERGVVARVWGIREVVDLMQLPAMKWNRRIALAGIVWCAEASRVLRVGTPRAYGHPQPRPGVAVLGTYAGEGGRVADTFRQPRPRWRGFLVATAAAPRPRPVQAGRRATRETGCRWSSADVS